MEDKAFQDGINFIADILRKQHSEQFNWAKNIYDNQQKIKKTIGITDSSMPWEPVYKTPHISPREPEIYNKYGEKYRVCFMSDWEYAKDPYYDLGRYIFFDRYNYGLKTHFYSHEQIFRTVGKPNKRFAWLQEAKSFKMQSYVDCLKNKEYIENNFELILSFDAEILTTFKNAKFSPCIDFWYGKDQLSMEDNIDTRGGGNSQK